MVYIFSNTYIMNPAHANTPLFELCKHFNIYLTFVGKWLHVGKITQGAKTPTMFKKMVDPLLCLRG